MSTLSPEARALAGAAGDYIASYGWCQFSYRQDNGRVCLTGAINRSAFEPYPFARSEELRGYLADALGREATPWNDDPSRTQGEVVGVLYAVEEGWL
jgi:hypothetical protein